MIDSSETDPAVIRATYQTRGRNAKLNIAKAESLGMVGSSITPAQQGDPATSPASGGSGGGAVLDPTLYADPGPQSTGQTFEETTYEEQVPPREFTVQP